VFAPIVLALIFGLCTLGCKAAQQIAKAEEVRLRLPRVAKPWKEALRLVGDGKTDGILIQPMRWDEPDPGMSARVTRKR